MCTMRAVLRVPASIFSGWTLIRFDSFRSTAEEDHIPPIDAYELLQRRKEDKSELLEEQTFR